MTSRVGQPAFGPVSAQFSGVSAALPAQRTKGPAVVRFSGRNLQAAGRNGLWVSVERVPAKVGGLGEVSKTIPEAINRYSDKDIRVLIPYLAPMKGEDGYEATGLSKTLIGFDGKLETFDLLQKKDVADDGTTTWVYAVANERYFGKHANLYFPPKKPTDELGDDAIFKSIMMFNRTAAAFAPELNASAEPKPGVKLSRFDGDCEFVMVHDWLSSPFLSELNEGYREKLGKLFMLHNIFDEPRDQQTARKNGLKMPRELGKEERFSPLGLGIRLADAVIANFNYARTIVHTNFAKNHPFVKDLRRKLDAEKVYDMHHGLSEAYSPRDNAALREDGFVELRGNDWATFKQNNKVALQQKYGLKPDPDAVVMSWAARFDPNQKGFYLLLNEMEDMLRLHPNLQLVVAGTPFETDGKIATEVNRLKATVDADPALRGRLCLPGFVKQSDIVKINAGSDFSILPSLYEPYGLTQLEALRLGAVPVVHGVDGLRSTVSDPKVRTKGPDETVWEYGQTGVLMKPLNVAPYRKAIRKFDKDKPLKRRGRQVLSQSQKRFRKAVERAVKLARSPEKMQQIRENGNLYVDEHHSWEKIVSRYVRLIDEVTAQKADVPQSTSLS